MFFFFLLMRSIHLNGEAGENGEIKYATGFNEKLVQNSTTDSTRFRFNTPRRSNGESSRAERIRCNIRVITSRPFLRLSRIGIDVIINESRPRRLQKQESDSNVSSE